MITASQIIDALGGTSEVTRRLAAKRPTTVSSWKTRGSIPPQWWPRLIAIARERQVDVVTLETLASLAAKKGRAAA